MCYDEEYENNNYDHLTNIYGEESYQGEFKDYFLHMYPHECLLCNSAFNKEKLKEGIKYCDNCGLSSEEAIEEINSEYCNQLEEDLKNYHSEVIEGLKY